MFLLNCYGEFADSLSSVLTEQEPYHVDFIECFAKGNYNELNYEKEAENQSISKDEFAKRQSQVFIPNVY